MTNIVGHHTHFCDKLVIHRNELCDKSAGFDNFTDRLGSQILHDTFNRRKNGKSLYPVGQLVDGAVCFRKFRRCIRAVFKRGVDQGCVQLFKAELGFTQRFTRTGKAAGGGNQLHPCLFKRALRLKVDNPGDKAFFH